MSPFAPSTPTPGNTRLNPFAQPPVPTSIKPIRSVLGTMNANSSGGLVERSSSSAPKIPGPAPLSDEENGRGIGADFLNLTDFPESLNSTPRLQIRSKKDKVTVSGTAQREEQRTKELRKEFEAIMGSALKAPPSKKGAPFQSTARKPAVAGRKVVLDVEPSFELSTDQDHAPLFPVSQQSKSKDPPLVPFNSKNTGNESSKKYGDVGRLRVPDITGLTEGLASPMAPPVPRHRQLSVGSGTLSGKGSSMGSSEDIALAEMLKQLKGRISGLERENAVSASLVRDLQQRLRKEDGEKSLMKKSSLSIGRRDEREEDGDADSGIGSTESHIGMGDKKEDGLEQRLKDEGEKRAALESLVQTLHSHISHLTRSLNNHSSLLHRLQTNPPPGVPTSSITQLAKVTKDLGDVRKEIAVWRDEVVEVREGLEGLGREVEEVRGMVESLLDMDDAEVRPDPKTQRGMVPEPLQDFPKSLPKHMLENLPPLPDIESAPGTPRSTISVASGKRWARPHTPRSGRSYIADEVIERLQKELDEEAQQKLKERWEEGKWKTTAAPPKSERPRQPSGPHQPQRPKSRTENLKPRSQSPPITQSQQNNDNFNDDPLFRRADNILKNVPKSHTQATCPVCLRRKAAAGGARTQAPYSAPPRLQTQNQYDDDGDDEGYGGEDTFVPYKPVKEKERVRMWKKEKEELPPQTVIARALSELEKDFEVHRKIFNELSEQYKAMDPTSKRRPALAEHLKESIDTLENKADHIRRLYDALHYRGDGEKKTF